MRTAARPATSLSGCPYSRSEAAPSLCATSSSEQPASRHREQASQFECRSRMPLREKIGQVARACPQMAGVSQCISTPGDELTGEATERRRAERQIQQLEELRHWRDILLDRGHRVKQLEREVNELYREALARLPALLRAELADALVGLDVTRIAALTHRVAELDSALGGVLEHCASRFQYTLILQALRPGAVGALIEESTL